MPGGTTSATLGMLCHYLRCPRPFQAKAPAVCCAIFQLRGIFRDEKERSGWQNCWMGSELVQPLLQELLQSDEVIESMEALCQGLWPR